jgi:pre-rRNA-processing protein IPI1
MAKKKKKEKDFQKIKLKVGRKLLRGINETKTDFKSKKIILKESELRSNDPLKTLSNNRAINSQIKLLCLNKLNNSLNSTIISNNSAQVINTVSKYLNDSDKRVRSDAIKCIKQSISLLDNQNNNNSISPIMSMILSYIDCGLTHIDHNISYDSLKLLSYIMEKCDNSLYDQLMQIIISRIGDKTNIDSNDYEICCKLITLMKKNDINNELRLETKESPVFKWSSDNYYCDLNNIINDNKPSFEFNLSFQINSSVDLKEKFITIVKNIVINDLKLLLSKNSKQLSFTIPEAKKAISVLNISSMIGLSSNSNDSEIPTVNIVAINANKKTSRQQQQLILHLKNELIIAFKKLLNNDKK